MPEIEKIRPEYCDYTDEQFEMAVFAELRGMSWLYDHPETWVTAKFKELFGKKPPGHFVTIQGTSPRPELETLVGGVRVPDWPELFGRFEA